MPRIHNSSIATRRKSISHMLGRGVVLAIMFAVLLGGPIIMLIIISGRMQ